MLLAGAKFEIWVCILGWNAILSIISCSDAGV